MDIEVAIGIIINPISLKKVKLIEIFNKTIKTEIWNGVFVLSLAKKKLGVVGQEVNFNQFEKVCQLRKSLR